MRTAMVERRTKETTIRVRLNLDGTGQSKISTGIGFFDHMLGQIARHALLDMEVDAQGDLHIDGHHTVEDVGIVLGQALAKALDDKKGVQRFGCAFVPLDEALARVVVDLSGRPGLFFKMLFARSKVGEFDVELVREFFQGLVNHSAMTVHIDGLKGDNAHHQCETAFKAFGRALREAITIDPRATSAIPSTKGSL